MISVNKGLLCFLISREMWNKLFPIKSGARPPAAAFSGMRVAFPGRVAAAGSPPAVLGTHSPPCTQGHSQHCTGRSPCTLGQESWWPLSVSKLQIHFAWNRVCPVPGNRQSLCKESALRRDKAAPRGETVIKVQQMMPINKYSIIKVHPGSQKEAAKSCNHTILQYLLQKVEKHIIYFGCKRAHRADYLRKLQPATKTSLSAFYLREWGCISDPVSYFRRIISLNHTAVICLHALLRHHYIPLSLTPSETDSLWGLLMWQHLPWICLYL